ncbi:phage major capsid protein [Mesorhizobium sp. WSM2239]|uniref:Phage major capsid protein n=2 Tax=unclassified Mesorhizobium TaxID=325217 RepID=A0AAU8D2X4_9HYPH
MSRNRMPNAAAQLLAMSTPKGLIGQPRMEVDDRVRQMLGEVRTELTRIGNDYSGRMETLETRQQDLEQSLAGQGRHRGEGGVQSWGLQVVQSDAYKGLRGNHDGRHRFRVEQAITSATGSAGALIPRDVRTDPIQIARRRLTVRDLLNETTTGSNLVEYARQTTRTNNASVVSEGAQKPESVYVWTREEAPVRTIAHWVPVSRQAMDDAGQLQGVIDGELRYGLDIIEEAQLLSGDGTGENLAGLIGAATTFNPPFQASSDTDIDVVLQAKAQLAAPGSEIAANGVILNTLDWERMTGIKDSDGRYLSTGPFGDTPEILWRLPVVASNSMPEGEFLVGDFRRAGTIYDRMEIEILVSSEDRDNFIKNMLTVRAEKRLALAVTMPAAMIYGQLSTAASG